MPLVEVIERYKSLDDIERGFRMLHSDLEIDHQTDPVRLEPMGLREPRCGSLEGRNPRRSRGGLGDCSAWV